MNNAVDKPLAEQDVRTEQPAIEEAGQPTAGGIARAAVTDKGAGEVGLGIDLVEIERMRKILARTPSFEAKVFSEEERAFCNANANRESHFATRFAAKEAVVKALGTGFTDGIGVRDIEVKRGSKGQPRIALHGRAKEIAAEKGVLSIPVSLSFTHTDAVACAMVITEESVQAAEQRTDPMKELAQQFKKARALLDEVDARPNAASAKGPEPGANKISGDMDVAEGEADHENV